MPGICKYSNRTSLFPLCGSKRLVNGSSKDSSPITSIYEKHQFKYALLIFLMVLPVWIPAKEKPDSSPKVYLESNLGYAAFSMNSINTCYIDAYYMDGHLPVYHEKISGGVCFEAEAGLIAGNFLKTGVFFIYSGQGTESSDTMTITDRDTNTVLWDSWYLDVSFRGAGLSCRYYLPLKFTRLKISAGGKGIVGTGRVNMGMGTRPSAPLGDYGYDNFTATGVGITAVAAIEYLPVNRISAGITTGYRILRTETLKNIRDESLWKRPPSDPHPINLDFSGFFIQALLGVEL
jgi:hypothetical protein